MLGTRQTGTDLTGTFVADLALQILSYVAQTEHENIRQRQMEGIAAARQRGIQFGRLRKPVPEEFHYLKEPWGQRESPPGRRPRRSTPFSDGRWRTIFDFRQWNSRDLRSHFSHIFLQGRIKFSQQQGIVFPAHLERIILHGAVLVHIRDAPIRDDSLQGNINHQGALRRQLLQRV